MFAILVRIDVQLAVISLGIVPMLYVWLRCYTARMQPAAGTAKQLESKMIQRLHDTLGAIRLVKSYAREHHEHQRFSQAAGAALAARLETTRQESLFAAVVTILTVTGTAAIVLVGGLSVLSGRISLGTLLLLIAYLGFVYGPLCGIANTTGALQQAVASARRIRETFMVPIEPADPPFAVEAVNLAGELAFDQVSFDYPNGTPVLRDVSFAVSSGQMIALVGMSGAGKSHAIRALEEGLENFAGCAVVVSHDRWFLDRVATHILAFEGDSTVSWFNGNYSAYLEDFRRRKGKDADQPHRIKYRKLARG
jgi:ABC-type multidrug transport system fused ATPase/permease subunit